MSSGLAGFAGDILGTKSTTALFSKALQSRTVQDSLIDRFDLLKVYGLKYHVDARKALANMTMIEEDKKSGVLSVTVASSDPALALALANGYVVELDRLISKVSTSSARREREFIEQRLTDEKKSLEQAERNLSQFSSGSMTLDVPQQIRVTVESAARVQGELIAARAELEGLQQTYTSENVRIKTVQARISELEKQLNKINGGPAARPGGQDKTYPYPNIKDLPALGAQWTDLYRESKVHEAVFELLTQQYEMARIQEAKEIPVVKVMDAPVMPEKRYPRPWRVALIGVVITGILACCGVVLQDRWERWDSRDPRRVLLSNVYYGTRNIWNKISNSRLNRGQQ
jgi:capsule polysaccharide export protein KpsE/RkpR